MHIRLLAKDVLPLILLREEGFIVVENSLATDPKQFMDLISILETYLDEEENTDRLVLIKDGVKILL